MKWLVQLYNRGRWVTIEETDSFTEANNLRKQHQEHHPLCEYRIRRSDCETTG